MTYSDTTCTVWLDGVAVFTSQGNLPSGANSYIYIGNATTGCENIEAVFDEMRISDTVRYTDTFSPAAAYALDSSTVALWHCDDGTGATLTDATGNHNGTLQGDPLPQWVAGKE
jgi:hypothetical protein